VQLIIFCGINRGVINLKTVLINVETILTDYVEQAICFWQDKADQLNIPLPEDFLESFLSGGFDQVEKTFFRFPHFKAYYQESMKLFEKANQSLNDDNPYLQQIIKLKQTHGLEVGLIYDQNHLQAKEVSKYLESKLQPIIQLYSDDAFLGKPEGNIFLKAKALKHLKASETLVADATKNGILAAFVAQMKGVYIDMGLGLSERLYKYSYRNTNAINELATFLDNEKNKTSFNR
jgi:beta-phosphoglucomutase-like phosphatase (HAD superfamily)